MSGNETALEMCLRMLKERAKYWTKNCDDGISIGYDNAATLLEFAMHDNIECLRQFDYYHEDEEEK